MSRFLNTFGRLALISLLVAGSRAAAQSTEDAIIARVNGEAVLLSQLKEAAFDQEMPVADISSAGLQGDGYRRALTQVVDEVLLVQKAQTEEIKVADMDLARQIDEMITNLRLQLGSQADLDRFLTEHHLTIDQLKRMLSDRERRRTLATQVVAKRVANDAGAIERFKQERQQQGKPIEEVRLAQILIKCSPVERETTKGKELSKKAMKIAEEAAADPSSFILLVRRYSDDKDGRIGGGDLGWVTPDSLLSPLRDQLAKLKTGEVSPPVTSEQGFHVLLMLGRHSVNDLQYISEFAKQRAKMIEQLRQEASLQLFDLKGNPLAAVPIAKPKPSQ